MKATGEEEFDPLVCDQNDSTSVTSSVRNTADQVQSPRRRFSSRWTYKWTAPLVVLSLLAMMGISSRHRLALPTFTNTPFASHYKHDRPVSQLGTDPHLYEPIHNPRKVQQRIHDMRLLEQVRSGHCGRFAEFLAGNTTTTNWRRGPPPHPDPSTRHCINGEAYRASRHKSPPHPLTGEPVVVPPGCRPLTALEQYICAAPHPTRDHVTITMVRYGRFTGRGGYDWTVVADVANVGDLQERLRGSSWAYVGGWAAPVSVHGTLLSYPPIHAHHTHVYPIGSRQERGQKIHGSVGDHHNLLLQTHGDTECLEENGGMACHLTMMDPGMARVIESTESGLSAEFELNDVRPAGSEPLDYFFEIGVMLAPYDPSSSTTVRKSTFMGIINPCVNPGPCIYPLPLDPNSNMMAYHYVHGEGGSDLSSGYMSNFVLHTHQTLMDSAFLFLSTNDAAYQAVNAFREDRGWPVILECLRGGQYDLESAKQEIFSRIHNAGGRLVCEATKPSLEFRGAQAYDRQSQLNCLKDPVPLNVGDVLTVVAFNQIQNTNVTRKSSSFLSHAAYSRTFSAPQHTIFRFDLSYGSKEEEPAYAPPGFFKYCMPDGPTHEATLDQDLRTGCPLDSIRYSME